MDDKTPLSSRDSDDDDKDLFLRHLNKLSHKISKPSSSIKTPPFSLRPPPAPPLHHQPPVYNINKCDFRDVVQKLTGSSSHAPPPIHAPKPASSRLQRIRPPPLVQLINRPPSMLNCAAPPPPENSSAAGGLSPLPPLPTCHPAAESPISAYMRFLRTSSVDSNVDLYLLPSSPLGFGRLPPSPRSPCQPLSPNLLLSPTGGGPLGFPASPAVSGVPSPKWRDC